MPPYYNPFSIANKTILVTGASSGIGQSVAIECSKLGAKLIITGRNSDRLNITFEQLTGSGHCQIVADLNADQDHLLDFVNHLPLLDGVVHCAGIAQTLPFQFATSDRLNEIMNINFAAPTLISAHLVKSKKMAKNSSIVFISSVSGVYCTGVAGSLYSASKGAVNGVVKGMAIDLASKSIRVNSVNPAMIDTNIYHKGVVTVEQLEADKKHYPMKRYGRPEEVAFAVIYLLSDASQWVTGSSLLIDGGFTLQ